MGLFSGGESRSTSGVEYWRRQKAADRGIGSASKTDKSVRDFAASEMPQLQMSSRFPGFFAGSEPAIEGITRNLYNRASASGAAKGRLTPMDSRGVAGSAAREAAKFFLPQMQENIKFATMMPENIRSNRMNMLMGLPSLYAPFTVGSEGSSKGPNAFGQALGRTLGQGAGTLAMTGVGAMFCWMAAAIYGAMSNEHTKLARIINTSNSPAAKKARALYKQFMPVFEELLEEN